METAEHPTFTLAQLLKGFVLISLLFLGLQGALRTYGEIAVFYWAICCSAFGGLVGVKHGRILESALLGVLGYVLGLLLLGIGFSRF